MKQFLIFAFLLLAALPAQSQKIKKVCGEYTYYVPEDVPRSQAMRIALNRARIQALADEFGTVVSQTNSGYQKNDNGQTDSHFFSIDATEVKGEWIADEGTPEYTYDMNPEDGTLVITCRVCGKAREIVNAQTDITVKVLRNGTEEKYESDTFTSGDDMYLYFRSPVDGYLAVYLVDETPAAYCLLPYRRDGDGQQEVKHGQEYVFFSPHHAGKDAAVLDEYTLTCARELEHNQLYVIFSSQPFTKALDRQEHDLIPRQLSYEDFTRWMVDCRKKDTKMGIVVKELTIKK